MLPWPLPWAPFADLAGIWLLRGNGEVLVLGLGERRPISTSRCQFNLSLSVEDGFLPEGLFIMSFGSISSRRSVLRARPSFFPHCRYLSPGDVDLSLHGVKDFLGLELGLYLFEIIQPLSFRHSAAKLSFSDDPIFINRQKAERSPDGFEVEHGLAADQGPRSGAGLRRLAAYPPGRLTLTDGQT